jgi:cephalosporin hydroxylase
MGLKNRIAVYSSRHYDVLRLIFSESLLHRCGIRRYWHEIDGWFNWRSAQEEAVSSFPDGSRFVEVGTYLGRSLCSLGEVVERSGKNISVIGVDSCRGSGPEGSRGKDYHTSAVTNGGGTFAGALHKNVVDCGLGEKITLIICDSVDAACLFADASLEWVHLDARHDYDSVKADIRAWRPKVKVGGWLSGDDYDEKKWPEVVSAVADTLPDAKLWSTQQWRWIVE